LFQISHFHSEIFDKDLTEPGQGAMSYRFDMVSIRYFIDGSPV
jgi:hypothetical protein